MRPWDVDICTLILVVFYKTKNDIKKETKVFQFITFQKTSTGTKPLRIGYNKIDGFIKIHNKIRYLVLFDEWCENICDSIKYVMSKNVVLQIVLIIILE